MLCVLLNTVCFPLHTETPSPNVSTGVPVRNDRCGRVSEITCSALVVDNLANPPIFMWVRDDNTVDPDSIFNVPNMISGGEYTCMSCINVSSVNLINRCSSISVSIGDESEPNVVCVL